MNLPIALVELHYETYKNNVLRVSRSTLFNIKASGITNLFYSLLKLQQHVLVIISFQENSEGHRVKQEPHGQLLGL